MSLKPTCREVHRLVSEGQDRDLSILEKIRVRVHLAICDACTTFNTQIGFLRRAMHKFEIPADTPGTPPAPAKPDAE
ncbi:zf-HC2 domain-containing protein [Actimicrobium sp. CCC2.4]|uniref:zf-HC2 domain-containing protein n=1 Tax=Actimicrobium sp. CCC2.4 TaxID=3048606 RepID=UPI002AC92829|nr:zf-HC2 domain-containing protein [Actimicrobium sp. CCC2.4]MEB0136012.1 zf-HC2 domain-containing protein [Actimicrobium sp. CCC2.4]WPX32675.1 zf-HC2 domain-containing protein [Actimicrobium sp. CCC2.4]